MALWAGLLGGLGEFASVMLRKYLFHRYIFEGADVAWMAPLSLGFLGVLAALPLLALPRSAVGGRRPGIPYTVLAFLAILNATPNIPGVHPLARLLLVTGVAWQLGVWAGRHREVVGRFARRTVVPLLLLVIALGSGFAWSARRAERRALAGLPSAAAAAPNVLLLILDTVRAMDLSLYGYARATSPELDRLAGRGVVFERAYAPAPWTLATHASIFTGHLPFETSVSLTTPLDARLPTLAEAFRTRGYSTAGFIANLTYVSRESGLARGFAHYEDYPRTAGAVLLGSALARTLVSSEVRRRLEAPQVPERKTADELGRDVLAWLARRPAGHPFFVFVNYWDAHAPYVPSPPFDTAFTGSRVGWKDRNAFLLFSTPVTASEAAAERTVYDQAIASQDHAIGQLLARLQEQGLLDNTLLVVTSDHGEEFGEHGLLDHGTSLNPAVLWVPLVMVFPPHLPAGRRLAEPVSLVDLAATMLHLADPNGPQPLPGFPLILRGGRRGPGP
ncbi:MAG TPA: sulfatase, partial [Gemmatimonadales bacterium]|nr:sulfatase [Gemmatimonadales bacterium]